MSLRFARRSAASRMAPAAVGVVALALAGMILLPATAAARRPRPGDVLSPMAAEAPRATEVRGRRGVVVANTPEAAAAGARVLDQGGNAVDAAVATAFALGVTEAEASGLGGMAWMLIHTADGRDVAIDGSGFAPELVDPEELRQLEDEGLAVGYETVAAPGAVAVLDQALRRFGTKTVAKVIAPAIELADSGVRLPPHQQAVLYSYGWRLLGSPTLVDIFFDQELDAWDPEHLFCMDAVASTMRRLARDGLRDFYLGTIADAIDADMRANGGFLRKSDLLRVRAPELPPVRGRYRGLEVLSFPDPGGGAAVIEALQILDRFPANAIDGDSVDAVVIRLEASRIALLDLYRAWPSGPLEVIQMLEPALAARRAALIDPRRALRDTQIVGKEMVVSPRKMPGSTHVSVVDGRGNAVSLSLTYNLEFGAGVATPGLGFPYNATLSLFDVDNRDDPRYVRAGAVIKQIASPTIVLRDGAPFMVLGSPGSGRITSAIVNTIVNVVDRRMSAADAVEYPRVIWNGAGSQPGPYLELAPPYTESDVAELKRRGYPAPYALHYPARVIDAIVFGGVNLAMFDPSTGEAIGAGDPRRAGTAVAGGPSKSAAPSNESR